MATNPEDEETSKAVLDTDVDQGIITSENNSQTTATYNEKDPTQATTEGIVNEDGSEKMHRASKRSASLASGTPLGVTDEDSKKPNYGASPRSVSLTSGTPLGVTDEDSRKPSYGASQRSVSLASGTPLGVTDEDSKKPNYGASPRSVSLSSGTPLGVTDKDSRKPSHGSSQKSVSVASGTPLGVTDKDSKKTSYGSSQRSVSLASGTPLAVTDEDSRKSSYGSSQRSVSLASGAVAGVADEGSRKPSYGASRRSVSLASGTVPGVTDEGGRKQIDGASQSKISIKTEVIDVSDEDGSRTFHQLSKGSASLATGKLTTEDQATKRSFSLGTETVLGVTDEDGSNSFHQVVKRRVSIAETVIDQYGSKAPTEKKIFEDVLDETDTEPFGSVMYDPSVPKGRLQSKRASFQTAVIEGFSLDDTKEDDDSEGDKLLWKRMFERKVAKRVLKLQDQKSIFLKKRRPEKAILEKKVPMDLLTKEWFNENKVTVQTRIYLLEKLLPTLILGLEKLLMEVEKKSLTVLEAPHPYFNPINFLAQYLIRNNPQYCSFPEEDPYILGLKHVVKQLKTHVVDIKDNRLSTLKAETKLRQKERERQDKICVDKQEKRRENLRLQFRDWLLSTNGNVMLSLAQSVLVSFSEAFADYLFETFEDVRYDKELDEIDTTGQTLNEEQFVEYMYSYVKSLSDDPFQDFLIYLSHSSEFFCDKGQKDWWREQFADLFLACDIGKTGFLYRHRVILLFEQFYDHHSGIHRAEFRNPRQWPVIEFDEMEHADFILDFGNDYISAEAHLDTENEVTADQEQAEMADQTPFQREIENEDSEEIYVVEGRESTQKKLARFSLTATDGDLISDKVSQRSIPDEQTAAISKFPDLASIISDIQSHGHTLITSPFDKSSLNKQQFVQLMETFLGSTTEFSVIESLINYIQGEYRETKEEKIDRLDQANREALVAMRTLVLEALFEKWDNNVSGYLNLRELADVLSTYKDGMEKKALKRAHHKLKLFHKYYGNNPTLSKLEFSSYIETIAAEISDNEADFDHLVTFLTTRNEQNCTERARSMARRKWLDDIQRAAETSSSSLEFVYKTVFQTLHKDSEAHGENKKISSSIALLRHNYHRPERGEYFLHYVACTLEDSPYVLNQALYRDMGVSFAVVDEGKPLHIIKVQEHGMVHIWNCHREKIDGSFLVTPLKDKHNRVFGVLGTDTLRDNCEKFFTTHEISFYQVSVQGRSADTRAEAYIPVLINLTKSSELSKKHHGKSVGVAKAFSIAYHHVRVRNDILKAVDSAILWLFNETVNIETVTTYLAEPVANKDYVLCKTMTTEYDFEEGWSDVHVPPIILQRKDNYFRNYLFRCADTSEVVHTQTSKGSHVCVPLRDITGRALAVLDFDLGMQNQLIAHEYSALLKMLKILHLACDIIVKEAAGTPEKLILADHDNEEKRAKMLFLQLMLQDLRESIKNLSEQELAELKSSEDPPSIVLDILQIVLYLLEPKLDIESITWDHCRDNLNSDLIQKAYAFDPGKMLVNVNTQLLSLYFKGLDTEEVWKFGSFTIYYLYHWAFVCFSLKQITRKLGGFYRPPSVCHLVST